MKTITKTVYQTLDGQEFDSLEKAVNYAKSAYLEAVYSLADDLAYKNARDIGCKLKEYAHTLQLIVDLRNDWLED